MPPRPRIANGLASAGNLTYLGLDRIDTSDFDALASLPSLRDLVTDTVSLDYDAVGYLGPGITRLVVTKQWFNRSPECLAMEPASMQQLRVLQLPTDSPLLSRHETRLPLAATRLWMARLQVLHIWQIGDLLAAAAADHAASDAAMITSDGSRPRSPLLPRLRELALGMVGGPRQMLGVIGGEGEDGDDNRIVCGSDVLRELASEAPALHRLKIEELTVNVSIGSGRGTSSGSGRGAGAAGRAGEEAAVVTFPQVQFLTLTTVDCGDGARIDLAEAFPALEELRLGNRNLGRRLWRRWRQRNGGDNDGAQGGSSGGGSSSASGGAIAWSGLTGLTKLMFDDGYGAAPLTADEIALISAMTRLVVLEASITLPDAAAGDRDSVGVGYSSDPEGSTSDGEAAGDGAADAEREGDGAQGGSGSGPVSPGATGGGARDGSVGGGGPDAAAVPLRPSPLAALTSLRELKLTGLEPPPPPPPPRPHQPPQPGGNPLGPGVAMPYGLRAPLPRVGYCGDPWHALAAMVAPLTNLTRLQLRFKSNCMDPLFSARALRQLAHLPRLGELVVPDAFPHELAAAARQLPALRRLLLAQRYRVPVLSAKEDHGEYPDIAAMFDQDYPDEFEDEEGEREGEERGEAAAPAAAVDPGPKYTFTGMDGYSMWREGTDVLDAHGLEWGGLRDGNRRAHVELCIDSD